MNYQSNLHPSLEWNPFTTLSERGFVTDCYSFFEQPKYICIIGNLTIAMLEHQKYALTFLTPPSVIPNSPLPQTGDQTFLPLKPVHQPPTP